MEKVENIAKYLLSLDKKNDVFTNNIIDINNHTSYEGNVRLNKYLHIIQMVYIAINGNKLFDEKMYAYENGVVVEEVMNNYKYLFNHKNEYQFNCSDTSLFVRKLFNVLKNAPLEDLIEISHQDEEWKKKHIFFEKEKQIIDPNSQVAKYKKLCADFIYLLNND